jgi:predicted nucleic acid-binding protein
LKACELRENYKFSYYDSLIISSAVLEDCYILFSEDMQDELIIENKLKIANPFK